MTRKMLTVRTNWTRAEIADLFDLPFTERPQFGVFRM